MRAPITTKAGRSFADGYGGVTTPPDALLINGKIAIEALVFNYN